MIIPTTISLTTLKQQLEERAARLAPGNSTPCRADVVGRNVFQRPSGGLGEQGGDNEPEHGRCASDRQQATQTDVVLKNRHENCPIRSVLATANR